MNSLKNIIEKYLSILVKLGFRDTYTTKYIKIKNLLDINTNIGKDVYTKYYRYEKALLSFDKILSIFNEHNVMTHESLSSIDPIIIKKSNKLLKKIELLFYELKKNINAEYQNEDFKTKALYDYEDRGIIALEELVNKPEKSYNMLIDIIYYIIDNGHPIYDFLENIKIRILEVGAKNTILCQYYTLTPRITTEEELMLLLSVKTTFDLKKINELTGVGFFVLQPKGDCYVYDRRADIPLFKSGYNKEEKITFIDGDEYIVCLKIMDNHMYILTPWSKGGIKIPRKWFKNVHENKIANYNKIFEDVFFDQVVIEPPRRFRMPNLSINKIKMELNKSKSVDEVLGKIQFMINDMFGSVYDYIHIWRDFLSRIEGFDVKDIVKSFEKNNNIFKEISDENKIRDQV